MYLTMQKMSLIEHTKQIIQISKNEGLTDAFFKNAKQNLNYVSRKIKLNRIEAVFFSHFLDNSNHATTVFDIGKVLKLDNLEIMKYLEVIESLEKKKYIQQTKPPVGDKQIYYLIPIKIQKMISKGKFSYVKTSGLNTEELFNYLKPIFDKCCDNNMEYYEYENEINDLLFNNKNLPLVKKLDDFELVNDEKALFISLCYVYLENEENEFSIRDIESLYRRGPYQNWRKLRSSLESLRHRFFKLNILDSVNKSGFGDRNYFCFSEDIQEILNQELKIQVEKIDNRKGLLLFDEIKEKSMFFNDNENRKLNELSSLLNEENFRNIQNRLSSNNLRSGFACLFSGFAGTGKTESVYQIARKTERDIMMVDISETKSKWFSESEKMTKAIFTKYKNYVNENSKAPILLFNEADAIFSKRRQLDDTRSGPGQTENAIQNIILQEMENLNGILICTTNMISNFDKAFERRFLYKIEFEKPAPNVRKEIWRSMIPDLSEKDLEKLSSLFEFSGGQIENVTRKRSIDIVLKGETPLLERIIELCEDELLEKENSKRIGFGN